ncbi:MAG: hypothetical protein V1726_04275, partial [Methanobacteriota archaeon]
MKIRRIVPLFFVLFLSIVPSYALSRTQVDSGSVVMGAAGGIGLHIIISNTTPDTVTVKYTIEKNIFVQEGYIYAFSGKTTIRSFFPIAFISTITVLLDCGEYRVRQNGFIIGVLVV